MFKRIPKHIKGYNGESITSLSERVNSLEREIKILKCDKHVWEEYDGKWMQGFRCVKCKKCGKDEYFTHKEWRDIQLDQALDEVERLGGEVDRGE